MSLYKGNVAIAGLAKNTIVNGFHIFDCKWADHLLEDMSWLRADTFSWQSGSVYVTAYNELVSEYNNASSTTETEGSITFKRTPKGYKIADSTQETAILNKYNTDGIAWYYILDTANTQFKLPRTKFGFEGLRDTVGNDVGESLPNITGHLRIVRPVNGNSNSDGALYWETTSTDYAYQAGGGSQNGMNIAISASRSSSVYQNNAPVQERATQMYLYFYVGEYAQSAIEQTAGINSELFNGKLDLTTYNNNPRTSAVYLKTTYVNGTSGYNIWANGYCEQWGRNTANLATVTLLKEYNSTNYTIQTCSYFYSGRSAYANEIPYVDTITVNSFRTWVYTYSHTLWKTSGYLAEGEY